MRIATLLTSTAVLLLGATAMPGAADLDRSSATAWTGRGPAAAAGAPAAPALSADPVLRRLRTTVGVEIDGSTRVARYEVQEEFRNDSPRVQEADYVYPVPPGAVLTELALFAGERRLEGEVLEADAARRIYEEIVRRRRDPALVELVGSDLIRARVFPIEPGQTRKMVLRYVRVLPTDAGVTRLTYPVVSGLMSPVHAEPVSRRHEPRVDPAPAPTAGLSMRVRIRDASRFGTPFSPTHRIDVVDEASGEVEVRVHDPGHAGEVELLLPLTSSRVGASVLAHSPAPESEAGYFLLLLTPPAGQDSARIPRDVTLVLDVSGSMSGHKLEQARDALIGFLRSLGERDRFRLITFASVVRGFRKEALPATAENVAAAIEHLRAVEADGSTNVYDALAEALTPSQTPGRLPLVVFLTDGRPTVSESDPERIAAAADRWRDGERIFAFGVGDDVNTYLLERMTTNGRGVATYVRPDEDVEGAVSALARKLGAPILADLRLASAPAPLEEIHPTPLPDLFRGEELVLLGRYRGGGTGDLVIEGERPGGHERLRYRIELPRRRSDDAFVARLWAARKAGALTRHLRLHGPDPETVEELRELGLRYGILTEYTSYLVEEPGMPAPLAREVMRRRAVDLAAPPTEQTGETAFRRARASSRLGQVASTADAEEALLGLVAEPVPGRVGATAGEWRRVERRLFVRREGTWVDVAVREEAPELAVAPYSDAWFELSRTFPGLGAAIALGERVKIAGEGLTLCLTPDGKTRLGAADRDLLRSAFPGEST